MVIILVGMSSMKGVYKKTKQKTKNGGKQKEMGSHGVLSFLPLSVRGT